MKKTLIVLLSLFAMALPLTAGGAGETTEPQSASNENVELTGSQIVAEPTTFTIFLTMNNMPFDSDWLVWQEAGRRTNVYLEGIIPQSNSNEEEAYNLMLSSGELADIIGYKDTAVLEQLGRDGGLIPLNDLIDQYAVNTKKLMEENPQIKKDITTDNGLMPCW